MNFNRIEVSHIAAFVLVMSVAGTTWAQAGTKDSSATQHVAKTMDSLYQQGAFDETEAQLLGTLKACGEQCSASVEARIWMYIGVVRVDGRHKPAQAKQAFDEAVKLDPGVQIDRAIASPAAASLLAKASASAREATQSQPPQGGTASPPVVEAQCNTDADCKGDRICVDRHCAWRAAASHCEKDTDCPGDAICKDSQCVASGAGPAVASSATLKPTAVLPLAVNDIQPVPVRFSAAQGKGSFAIRAIDSDQQCTLPCTLNLAPGRRTVKVSGDGEVTEEIVVPNTGGDYEVRRGISGQFYWGLGAGILGAGLLTAGVAVKASWWNCNGLPITYNYSTYEVDSNSATGQCLQQHGLPLGYQGVTYNDWRDDKNGTWIPLVTAGAAAIVTGGILMLTGRNQLQVKPASQSSASNASSSFPIPHFSLGLGNGNFSVLASGLF